MDGKSVLGFAGAAALFVYAIGPFSGGFVTRSLNPDGSADRSQDVSRNAGAAISGALHGFVASTFPSYRKGVDASAMKEATPKEGGGGFLPSIGRVFSNQSSLGQGSVQPVPQSVPQPMVSGEGGINPVNASLRSGMNQGFAASQDRNGDGIVTLDELN